MAVLMAAAVAGCAGDAAPSPVPSGQNASSPLKVRDNVIYSNLTRRYTTYLKASDAVLQAGGGGVNSLRSFLSPSQFESETRTMRSLKESRRHTVGNAVLIRSRGQAIDRAQGSARIYFCLDSKSVKVVNFKGRDVTPSNREDKRTLLVAFDQILGAPRITDSQTWSGSSIC